MCTQVKKTHNGQWIVETTFQMLENAGWNSPDCWGLLGKRSWSWEETVRFVEQEDGYWLAKRQSDDGEWYVCAEEIFLRRTIACVVLKAIQLGVYDASAS